MLGNGPSQARRWVLGAVGVVSVAAVSWWLGAQVSSPEQTAGRAAPPEPSVVTAEVERRSLREDIVTRGEPTAQGSVPLAISGAVAAPDPVVTKVHIAPGQQMEEGVVAVEVSARPIFVFAGELPMYRDLRPGDEGEDVHQLQAALTRLGYMGGADGSFGQVTTQAIWRFYEDRGFDPVETTPTSSEGETAPTSSPTAGDGPSTSVFQGDEGSAPANETAPAPSPPVLLVPRGELTFVPSLPATVESVATAVGSAPASPLASLSVGELAIRSTLTSTQAAFVAPGATALVELPDGTNVEAVVSAVTRKGAVGPAPGATSGDTGASAPTDAEAPPGTQTPSGEPGEEALATLIPQVPVPRTLVGQSLRIVIRMAASDPVLVVPVTAVDERADGEATVVVVSPGGDERSVRVEPGESVGGFVAVEGNLKEGNRVIVSR